MSNHHKTRIPRGDLERGTPASATTKRLEPGTPEWKAALEQLRADGLLEADEAPAYTPTDGAPSHPCEVCGEQARRTWTGGWDRVCSTECDRQQRAEAETAEAETGKDAQEDEMAAKKTATCTECGQPFETSTRKQVCGEACEAARTRRYSREYEERQKAKRAGKKTRGKGSRKRKPAREEQPKRGPTVSSTMVGAALDRPSDEQITELLEAGARLLAEQAAELSAAVSFADDRQWEINNLAERSRVARKEATESRARIEKLEELLGLAEKRIQQLEGRLSEGGGSPDQAQTRTVEAELEEARQTIETLEQNCRSLEAKVQAELERADKALQQLETERRNASIIVDMQTAQEVVAERDALRAELKRAEDWIKEHEPHPELLTLIDPATARSCMGCNGKGVVTLTGYCYCQGVVPAQPSEPAPPLTAEQANAWRETLRELFDLGAISKVGLAQQLLELTRRETGVELSIELGEVAA